MTRLLARKTSALILGFGLTATTLVSPASQPEQLDYTWHNGGSGIQLQLPKTTACLNAAVAAGRANNSFSGIATSIVLDGRIVYHQGFGTVSPTATQPVLPSTRFRIGSITKSVTATALLSLVDDRRLNLHSRATELLPGFELPGEPGWSDRLTVHRLLSHQGGILEPDDLEGPSDDGALAAAFYDPAFTSRIPLMVPPGSFYNYSNANFMLAGLLAETAAGRPYRDVVRHRVFNLLGMTRSAFLSSVVTTDTDIASGVEGNAVIAPGAYDNGIARPAGYAWSSTDDLAKFARFLLRGNPAVLSPHLWRAMQTPQVNMHEFLDYRWYGYGLVIEDALAAPDAQNTMRFYDGVRVVWHNGAINGYRSLMMTMPRQQFAYVALVNGSHDLFPCFRVAAAEAVGKRLPAPSPFPDPGIQRDRFIDYVGNYSDHTGLSGNAVVTLTPSGDLHIELPALDQAGATYDPILRPTGRDNFVLYLQGTPLAVTGIRKGNNTVMYLRSRDTVMTRVTQ